MNAICLAMSLNEEATSVFSKWWMRIHVLKNRPTKMNADANQTEQKKNSLGTVRKLKRYV